MQLFFNHAFMYLGMHSPPPSFIAIFTHLKCYTTNDVHLILLCGTKQLKKIGLQFQE